MRMRCTALSTTTTLQATQANKRQTINRAFDAARRWCHTLCRQPGHGCETQVATIPHSIRQPTATGCLLSFWRSHTLGRPGWWPSLAAEPGALLLVPRLEAQLVLQVPDLCPLQLHPAGAAAAHGRSVSSSSSKSVRSSSRCTAREYVAQPGYRCVTYQESSTRPPVSPLLAL